MLTKKTITTINTDLTKTIDFEDFKVIDLKDVMKIPSIDPYADNNIFGSSC